MTLTFKSMFEVVLRDFSSFVTIAVERATTGIAIEGISIFQLLLLSLTFGFLTASIANHKGGSFFKWFLAGALLGIIVLPIALFKTKLARHPAIKKCPNCAGHLPIQAFVCDACDYNFLSTMVGYGKPVTRPGEHLAR